MKALLIGFPAARAEKLAKTFGDARIETETVSADGAMALRPVAVAPAGAVFLNTEMGVRRLQNVVERLRKASARIPIVLTYGAEPGGRLFEMACKHDCWLFSEADRLARGLTAQEVIEALKRREADETRSRLVDVSLCSGPCSTGD